MKPLIYKESDDFTGSSEIFAWLSQFINLERGQTARSFRLERMETLAEIAGHPERAAPVIHVAGSKGKGSVCALIGSILGEAGLGAAVYASPHVLDYRERITLAGKFFDEDIYAAAGNKLKQIADNLKKLQKNGMFDPASPHGEEPTFFEFFTLYFFLCAACAKADVMIVETGMGGRLDATNIVTPLVSAISSIELEHTEYLGSTLEEIAVEKAGIIKPGRPLVLARQKVPVLDVFKKLAGEKGSVMRYLPEEIQIEDIRVHGNGTSCVFRFPNEGDYGVELSMTGEVQAANAGLAALAVRTAFPEIGMAVIQNGLKRAVVTGRFEKAMESPVFIIDGAHTPVSVSNVFKAFTGLYGFNGILLFGCAADKDAGAMAREALACFSRVIITAPGTFKTSDPQKVYRVFRDAKCGINAGGANGGNRSGFTGPEILCIMETVAAIEKALAFAREKSLPILGTGSFYLAGEIKKYLAQ